MKSLICGGIFWSWASSIPLVTALTMFTMACQVAGDEIRMQNGDTYYGRVLSFNGETLLLQSDVLGTLKVPQGKVLSITFGATPNAGLKPSAASLTNRLIHAPLVSGITNRSPQLAQTFRELNGNSNLVQQVQAQILAEGGPQARDKFNELLSGLMSGKMDLNGLLVEAKSAAAQARAARKELGEDAGSMIDGYLAILDGFIREAEPVGSSASLPPSDSPAPGIGAKQASPSNSVKPIPAEE